ncbi:MAG: LysE family transporter [Rhodobacteraceae bacterium]|nr:LysE family transporter [Paracoccaceae bacterium]
MASPGPALLYALRNSLAGGFGAGMATGAGLGLIASLWTGLALVGLDGLFRLFPWAYVTLKVLGALYLLYIAVQTWRHATAPLASTPMARRHAFVGGVMVNLANPKAVLFAAAVLLVIFPPTITVLDRGLIVANQFLVELAVYTAFAALLTGSGARDGYLRAKPVLDRIAAGVLGALGLRLLLAR